MSEAGEPVVFESVRATCSGTDAFGDWRSPPVAHETVHEPELLLVVTEVKSLPLGPGAAVPARQLLAVIPSLQGAPFGLQDAVSTTARTAGLSVYLPGNCDVDVPQQKRPGTDPNGLWRGGPGSVLPVMQLKVSEVDVVYMVGLEHVISNEDHLPMRIQLFVGIGRS